ncbi:hydrogenase 3 maturation protease [Methanobrevibacter millerae]|uniref:Hydrogenase 3 maturation protease n=1 Tax=Methanobrevibacter millerae TaxID=230361 RepID=A0A1G5XNF0_9EURY|nr:hydrogenase maturation peptidase HycI [Methanobrevibacter millerae]SDA71456.1 hydrogenase 3 maturation protease [Methanobrevibacter millerae]
MKPFQPKSCKGDNISFKEELRDFLKDYEKLIILGIGNELRYDDGVGPFIISNLNKYELSDKVMLINAQTVPENFTGKIRIEKPSHIIIIDACLMGLAPGEFKIVDEDDFAEIGISTHSMSLSYFVKFLNNDNVLFIGIEPETLELIDQDSLGVLGADLMDFNGELTENVQKSAEELVELLRETLT